MANSQVALETSASTEDALDTIQRGFQKLKGNEFRNAKRDFLVAATDSTWRKSALLAAAATCVSFHNVAASASDEAMQCCRELTREYPEDPEVWLTLGQCWLDVKVAELGDSAEGIHCFRQATALDPRATEAWYGLGMLLQHTRDPAGASDAYYRVLGLNPAHVAARFRLWTLALSGHVPEDAALGPLQAIGTSFLEVPFAGLDSVCAEQIEVLRCIQRAGTVKLRGALPAEKVQLAFELASEYALSLDYPNLTTLAFDSVPEALKALLTELVHEHLFVKVLPIISPWAARGWKPFRNPAWWLQYFLPNSVALGKPGTHLHQDHPLNCQQSDWVTFWTALSVAAPRLAPSLRVLTVPLTNPIDPLEQGLQRINPVPIAWLERYFEKAMLPLSADVGDVVTFGRHMIHDTHFDAEMTRARLSFDVRFVVGPSRFATIDQARIA